MGHNNTVWQMLRTYHELRKYPIPRSPSDILHNMTDIELVSRYRNHLTSLYERAMLAQHPEKAFAYMIKCIYVAYGAGVSLGVVPLDDVRMPDTVNTLAHGIGSCNEALTYLERVGTGEILPSAATLLYDSSYLLRNSLELVINGCFQMLHQSFNLPLEKLMEALTDFHADQMRPEPSRTFNPARYLA